MSSADPYRHVTSSSWMEEELWLRLDDALVEVIRDPVLAWGIAWMVCMDSADFPDVVRAAERLMSALTDTSLDV